MREKTIAGMWQIFRMRVVPIDASYVQVTETRKAFYAGCVALLDVMDYISEEEVSEEQGMEILEALHQEIDTFKKEIMRLAKENS